MALEILVTAGLIAAPAPHGLVVGTSSPRIATVAPAAPLRPAWSRIVTTSRRPAPGFATRMAVGLGASLAWDIADLPRRNAPLPEPIGTLSDGPGFPGGDWTSAAVGEPGGAIGVMLDRWNRLYPPYAIQSWDLR